MPVINFHDQAVSSDISSLFDEVEKQLYLMPFATKKSDKLVPKGQPIARGAKTYSYFKATGLGVAAIMDDHSDVIPSVNGAFQEVQEEVKGALTSYSYSVADLEAANFSSQNIDMSLAMNAREACDVAIDKLRIGGLISNENITLDTTDVKITAMTSFDQVTALFRDKILNGVNKTNKDTVIVDTVVLPRSSYVFLATKTYSQYDSETWLNKLKAMFPEITTWEFLDELEEAGVGSTSRMILYAMNPLYGRSRPQIPFETLPVQYNKFKYETYCRSRSGGFDVVRPTAFLYVDGV